MNVNNCDAASFGVSDIARGQVGVGIIGLVRMWRIWPEIHKNVLYIKSRQPRSGG